MRDIILGGLLLPLRLYFQPTAFTDEVAALAPDLPRRYNFWQARGKLREPAFRRGVARLMLQAIVALLWVPILAGLFTLLGYRVNWGAMVVGLVSGMGFGIASGLAGGVASGMAGSVAGSVAWGVTWCLTGGVVVNVMGELGRDVTITMIFGVPFDMPFGAVAWVAAGMMAGIAVGLAGSVAAGVAVGVVGGVVFGTAVGLAGSVGAWLAEGVTVGMTLGIGLGVTSCVVATHLWLFPFQSVLTIANLVILRFRPAFVWALWRFSPARWDEIILLPLPGLASFLVRLNRSDPVHGRMAITEVAAHPFQSRAATAALVRLAQEDALLAGSLPALAAYERGLDWLAEDTRLSKATSSPLLALRDASREVAGALESDLAANQVRRLQAAAQLLEALTLQPGALRAAPARWANIVAEALREAEQRLHEEEPIPQVYITDGRPVLPEDRAIVAQPFKGRESLFRRLEDALGGGVSERTTYLLYGQRRAGKTSALLHLPRRLGSRIVPAFLDLQSPDLGGASGAAGLLAGVTNAVLEEARRRGQMRLPGIDRVALQDDPYPALSRWLDQVERALSGRTLLLCLDEFEALEGAIGAGRLDSRFLATIRHIVQHRRNIAVLLAGSHQIDELPPHWAGALVTTTTLPISYLDEADARELIERPVPGFPAIYAPAAVNQIIRVTRCQPYLVQLLCALLVERMNAARRTPPASLVTPEDVEGVIPVVLERGSAYFYDLWRSQAGGDHARRVLEALAHAPGERLGGAALRQAVPDAARRDALAIPLRRELIEHDGDGYRVGVPLVAAYVRRVTSS